MTRIIIKITGFLIGITTLILFLTNKKLKEQFIQQYIKTYEKENILH